MTAKDLERLLVVHGVGGPKMDAVTRKLRAAGALPTGGRGLYAPNIEAPEAARVLIAVAGSSKGNEADVRLAKLIELKSTTAQAKGRSLLTAVEALLAEPAALNEVTELRVGRTTRVASLHFRDQTVELFVAKKATARAERFSVEGVLPSALLELVARCLSDPELTSL